MGSSSPGLTRLFTRLAAESLAEDHPGHGWFVERFRRTRAVWARSVRREQDAGRLDPGLDVDLLVSEMVGTWEGLALLDPERVDLVGAMAAYLNRLRREIAAQPAGNDSARAS